MNTDQFQQTVWQFYEESGRHDLPWRIPEQDGSFDPYKILVSEIMLQQTQVVRVTQKYSQFLERFPTVQSLSQAPLGDVLREWQGLGYNRRAKFLWQATQMIEQDFEGIFPKDQKELTKLPGVGLNTTGAICAYSWNQPVIFVETNIRSVYIHHFFTGKDQVSDSEIVSKVHETLDRDRPREWYWALMDYGSYLKKTAPPVHRSSKSYAKQSTFKGSDREIRGKILRELTKKELTSRELCENINDKRVMTILDSMVSEGLVQCRGDRYFL